MAGPAALGYAPEFTSVDNDDAEDDGPVGTPRPYGRLSIYTLHDDKTREFDRLAERAAEGVRTAEPDTLVYVIHVVPKAPMQRIIYEIYRDRAAFLSHERQPHIRQFAADRASCVLATNIIDLRLKYAKVASLGSPPEPSVQGHAQHQASWNPRAAEAAQGSDRYSAAHAQYSPAQTQPSTGPVLVAQPHHRPSTRRHSRSPAQYSSAQPRAQRRRRASRRRRTSTARTTTSTRRSGAKRTRRPHSTETPVMERMGRVTASIAPLTATVTRVPPGMRMVAVTPATAIRALMATKVPTVTQATMATPVPTDTRAPTATQVPMVTRTGRLLERQRLLGRQWLPERQRLPEWRRQRLRGRRRIRRERGRIVRRVGQCAVRAAALPRAHQRAAARRRRGRLPGQREPLPG